MDPAASTSCKICGKDAPVAFAINKSRIVGEPVREETEMVPYHRCATCGFVFTRYFDAYTLDQFSREIYNQEYWTKIDPNDRSQMPLRFVQRFSLRPPKRILDFGCGSGKGVAVLVEHGYDAYGYDIGGTFASPDRCSSQWEKLPKPFDFIFSFEVLEHLPNPLEFFERAANLLKPKGTLFFTTELYDEAQGRDHYYIAPRNGHISIYTRAAIEHACGRYGYDYVPMFRANMHACVSREVSGARRAVTKARYVATTAWQKLTGSA